MPSTACTPMGVEAAAWRFVPVRAPMRGREHQGVGEGHRGLDVQDGAEVAGAYPFPQLDHLGMEASIVAEPERDARQRATAATASSASSLVSVNGFSQKTCFLAVAAAITCEACME